MATGQARTRVKGKRKSRAASSRPGRKPARRKSSVGPIDRRPAPVLSASEAIDQGLAASALEKRTTGQVPTAREVEALRRVERTREETQRWLHYRSCPQKHYRAMVGRTGKVVREHAERFKLPIGATVDLGDVLRRFHTLLVEHRHRFRGGVADTESDPLLLGGTSPALERYRKAKAALAELDVAAREGELMLTEHVQTILATTAARIRQCGELLQRQFGGAAAMILNDAIDDVEHTLEGLFSGGDDELGSRPKA